MNLIYPAVFYPCKQTGGYAVEVPDLPGCLSQGETLTEAMLMINEAAAGWILGEMEDGNPVPPPSPREAIIPDSEEPDGFVNLISLDLDEHARKFGRKVVRKNITIPAYLNTFAESQNLNFSKVLQESLAEKYARFHV